MVSVVSHVVRVPVNEFLVRQAPHAHLNANKYRKGTNLHTKAKTAIHAVSWWQRAERDSVETHRCRDFPSVAVAHELQRQHPYANGSLSP